VLVAGDLAEADDGDPDWFHRRTAST
jgi:hypothetical protein